MDPIVLHGLLGLALNPWITGACTGSHSLRLLGPVLDPNVFPGLPGPVVDPTVFLELPGPVMDPVVLPGLPGPVMDPIVFSGLPGQ